jgi:AcrR family transcriptional regulator
MRTPTKMSSDERRAAIIKAARRVFADNGFDGTTTRELAKAAGVSEALLFKHFPDKGAIFAAMQLSCFTGQYHGKLEQVMELEPSTETLVLMVHFLISFIVGASLSHDDEIAIYNRLMLRSLAEDGEFARLMLDRPAAHWIPKCQECIQAAMAAGDTVEELDCPRALGWFAYQLAAMIRTHLLPDTPAVDYQVPHDVLIEQAVGFILRGMGVKAEVIKRNYNPAAFALLANGLLSSKGTDAGEQPNRSE